MNNRNINKNRTYNYLLNNNFVLNHKKVNPTLKKNKTVSINDNRFKEFDVKKSFFEIKDKNNQVFEKLIKEKTFHELIFLYIIFFKSKKFKIKFYESFRKKYLVKKD